MLRSGGCHLTITFGFTGLTVRWSETKNLKILIIDNFFLSLDRNKTFHSYRTWEYIVKREAKIFVTVIVSMITV